MIAKDIHEDTIKIAEVLYTCPIGGLITFEQMSTAIGKDVRGFRNRMYSAIEASARDRGILFKNVRGEGYLRLETSEISKVGATARSRIRNVARRGRKAIASGLKFGNGIAPKDLVRALSEQSALSLIEHLSKDRKLPKIKEDATKPMQPAQVMRQMLSQQEAHD